MSPPSPAAKYSTLKVLVSARGLAVFKCLKSWCSLYLTQITAGSRPRAWEGRTETPRAQREDPLTNIHIYWRISLHKCFTRKTTWEKGSLFLFSLNGRAKTSDVILSRHIIELAGLHHWPSLSLVNKTERYRFRLYDPRRPGRIQINMAQCRLIS